MDFKGLKKYIRWFCKTGLNRRKTQEKDKLEEKYLALNAEETKYKNKSSKFFRRECKNCGKFGHRAS